MPKIRIEHLWLWLPLFAILLRGMLFPLPVLDFWWHLKMGEVIVTTGSIPRTDLFSFTALGKPFLVQNWLADVLYYLIYRAGGLPLLVWLHALLLVAVTLPVYSLCRESTNKLRLSVVVTVIVTLTFFGNPRPQVFSFVFFSLFYWVLEGYRHQRRDFLWILPILMLLWVNLHGAFVVGLGLIALYLGSEALRHLLDSSALGVLSLRQLRKLLLVLGVSMLATLVNPETYKVYDYIRVVTSDAASQRYVIEWQPPRIDTIAGVFLFYGLFFITMLALFYSDLRPGVTDLALFLGFSIFAMWAVRNVTWFSIIAAPLLARYLALLPLGPIWTPLRRFRFIESLSGLFSRAWHAPAKAHYGFNTMLAGVALLALVLFSPWVRPRLYNKSLMAEQTPIGAMTFFEQKGLEGNIFHPQIFGDYLIWRLWPRQRSFIDGRVHLFGESFVQDYDSVFKDSLWGERLDHYKIRYLLLSKDPGEEESRKMADNARSSAGWTVLYEDPISIVFEKKHF